MSACRWCDNAPHAGLCDLCQEKADMMADGRPQGHYGTPGLVCPHCGRSETDPWQWFDLHDGEADIECADCGRTYHATQEVEITYSSEPIGEEETAA